MNNTRTQTQFRSRAKHAGVVAALIAALAMLVACGNSSRAHAAQKSTTQHAQTKRWFRYGMTKKQVIRIIGRPKSIRGNYWYYPVVHGLIANKVRVVVYGTNVLQPANQ